MKKLAAALTLVCFGCSDPATSALRGDASRDLEVTDTSVTDTGVTDTSVTDTGVTDVVIDAPAADAADASLDVADVSAADSARSDATDASDASPTPRVVQLGGVYVSAGIQSRLDALYSVVGVSAQRLEPGEATPERLRNAVIVATFGARPADWTSARFQPVLEAIRAGAWMLADAFGPWPLHEAGALSVDELFWARTEPCVGTFFWLRPASGEASYFAFAGIEAWMPTSDTAPQDGPVALRYSTRAAMMTIPAFGALLPVTRARHSYLQYVQSYCEPDVSLHPWCVDNARFCNGERGVLDAQVDEFTIGAGRVFNVTSASHSTASLQWGEVITRMQANVLREGLRRLAP